MHTCLQGSGIIEPYCASTLICLMSHVKKLPSGRIKSDGTRVPYTCDTSHIQSLTYNPSHTIVAAASESNGPESIPGRLATERRSQKHTYTSIWYEADGAYP